MAFCPNCGFQLINNDKFCPNCGKMVDDRQVPVQEVPVQEVPVQEAPVQATPVYTAPSTPVYPIPNTPVYTAPTAQAYQPHATAVTPEVQVSGGDKAKGFIGMGLSIFGIFMAVIGILYTIAFMPVGDGFAFGFALVYCVFPLVLGIIGRSLGSKSEEAGFQSGACSAAKSLGIASIIVAAVILFFGFISLGM